MNTFGQQLNFFGAASESSGGVVSGAVKQVISSVIRNVIS